MGADREGRGGGGPLPGPGVIQARIANYFNAHELEPATSEMLEKLALHLSELYRWNRRINLTAIRDLNEGIRRHVAESWEGVPFVKELLGEKDGLLVDLGSGNGFPALPLLVAFPNCRGILFESTGRKTDFLRSVIRKAGIAHRVQVRQTRVRKPGDLPADVDIFTLRAFPEPSDWIPRLLPPASRLGVLAWLSSRNAEDLAVELRRQGASAAILPLRAHPAGSILSAR